MLHVYMTLVGVRIKEEILFFVGYFFSEPLFCRIHHFGFILNMLTVDNDEHPEFTPTQRSLTTKVLWFTCAG